MALLDKSFVTDDEADAGFELIPAGTICTVVIKDSDIKTTSRGDGEYIKITMEIMDDGKYHGAKLWHNFNVVNPNEKAVQIGRGQLKRLNQILGIAELQDTTELHGQPFRVQVGIQKGTGGYDDSNNIKKFLPLDSESESGSTDGPWEG